MFNNLGFDSLSIVAHQNGFLFVDKDKSKKMEQLPYRAFTALLSNISNAAEPMSNPNHPYTHTMHGLIKDKEKALGRKLSNEEFLDEFFKLGKNMPSLYREDSEEKRLIPNQNVKNIVREFIKFREKNNYNPEYILTDSLEYDEYNRFAKHLANSNSNVVTAYSIRETENDSKQEFHFRKVEFDGQGGYVSNGKLDEFVISDSASPNAADDSINNKETVYLFDTKLPNQKLVQLDPQSMFGELNREEKALLEIKYIPEDASENYINHIVNNLDDVFYENKDFMFKALKANPAIASSTLDYISEEIVLSKDFLKLFVTSDLAKNSNLVKQLLEDYDAEQVLGNLGESEMAELIKKSRLDEDLTRSILQSIKELPDNQVKIEVLKSIDKYPDLHEEMDDKFMSDPLFAYTVARHGKGFYKISEELLNNEKFILSLIKQQPKIIKEISSYLSNDWSFMEKAMKRNPESFIYFSDEMQKTNKLGDKQTAIALLKENHDGKSKNYIRYFADSVRLDPEVSKAYIHNFMSHDLGIKFTDKEAGLIIKHYPEVDLFANLVKGQSKEEILEILRAKEYPSNDENKRKTLYMFGAYGFEAFEGDMAKYMDPKNSNGLEHSLNIVSKDTEVNEILKEQSSSKTKTLNWIIAAHGDPEGIRFGGEEGSQVTSVPGGLVIDFGSDEEDSLNVNEKEHYEKWKPHIRESFEKEGVLVLHSCSTAKKLEENDDDGDVERVVNFAENIAVTILEVINSKENQAKKQGERLDDFTIYAAADIASSEGGYPKPKYNKQGKIIDMRFNVYDRQGFLEQMPDELRDGRSGEEIRRDLQARLQKPTLKFVITSKGIESYQRIDKLGDDFGEWIRVENPETLKQYSLK